MSFKRMFTIIVTIMDQRSISYLSLQFLNFIHMAIFTTLRVLKHKDEKACFTYFMISMEKNKEYFKIFSSEKRIISFKNLEINIKLYSYIQYIVLC